MTFVGVFALLSNCGIYAKVLTAEATNKCVCVCACVRACVCVCVCMCASVSAYVCVADLGKSKIRGAKRSMSIRAHVKMRRVEADAVHLETLEEHRFNTPGARKQ